MKKIAIFCIPAHGHTNPILPVAAELVRRGDQVRFYSFEMFREKITATGAECICCDKYLPELTGEQEQRLKQVSITEMTIQDLRITMSMDDFLAKEFASFQPDVVYSDSACFWGKLNAWKFEVPLVVSTSTFAFNKMSSSYMKNSPGEIAGLLCGMPKMSAELKKLEPYGYHVKGILQLVQSDNSTDSVVYTSERFQPFVESFSDHYAFVGPSVFSDQKPQKHPERPLVYISMGTVINDRPDFYRHCIEALRELPVDVIISCGQETELEKLGTLPEHVKVYPYVDQLSVLAETSVFITHCGMNSVSESLYMAAPMVLYPQTNEQGAVARRASEMGAGVLLKDDSPAGIRSAVERILHDAAYAKAAEACCADFRSCSGAAGAADFIEQAPHASDGRDVIKELGRTTVVAKIMYSVVLSLLGSVLFHIISPKFLPFYIIGSIFLSFPYESIVQSVGYKRLIARRS